MTPEELADWTRLNWQARLNLVHVTPCEDCTASFSAEMRALDLCNGFPGPQRYCARCERWWPDGRQHWLPFARGNREAFACRVCRRRSRMRRYYQAHRELRLAYGRAWRAANREHLLAYNRRHYQTHRSERLAYQRAYDTAHQAKP
jgi:hypothetical protein